ncbi:uncharacterized protein A4U43_C07F14570 [Asparagus officinalis]|uniref:Uncharacterized protein n=1 Tax=Asparagus officinalis TaxID=4686 RepID=A0A5P1EC43_ASPOF|nr:uncharacterized protein LOC109850023 [Asparagus officinalis]ONK63384.1 uncharacterized protein A4U43_C07F14570 [Asparagus officinalis]
MLTCCGNPTPLKLPTPTVRSKSNGHRTPLSIFLRSLRPRPSVSAPLRYSHPHLRSPKMSLTTGNLTELNDESDLNALSSPDGYLSICGFGSLLSERSARSTFPDLRNFRVGVLRGFRRVFAHVAPIFFERGIANQETGEVSSLSVEPCDGETLIVTVFEIGKSEVPAFIEREIEFRFLAVIPESLDGTPYSAPAVVCARYSDEEYLRIRCKGSKEIFFQNYGRYNVHKIWRDDILPCRVYLRHCVLAAKNLSEAAYENFLDHTFLADRKTTIRDYLASTGSGIMEEEPPEALKSRYGG